MHSYEFFIESEKKHIDFINKIIEAYEGVGVVRTLDAKNGLLKIISTSDYADLVRGIVEDLDARGVTAKITKEGPWEGVL
ncbi:DUF4911 domain-containing protein [Propionigenium maris DSM 9537]|uniref:DUF4911 domain-containing protein n=1 Tax=Propionigenium maris DSM 9537 TaxID=1123000 RepID=A0A9W6GKY9_9FUSO|nr:DUF4911 domain-containing protein [Propionigenium maris]GLI55769.1 DUF4911 domain-containing protein [Propionigenium maris DSM 9537]